MQRVLEASVAVDGRKVSEVGPGLLVLLGVGKGDEAKDVAWMAEKLANLRIFEDEAGKMNRSLLDTSRSCLVVSQFTLYGDCRKGRRPGFTGAAPPAVAEPLYEAFVAAVRALGVPVATGRFAADMQVELVNDGPVTILVDSTDLERPRRHGATG